MASKDNSTAVRRGYLTLHRNPGGRFPLSTLSSKRMWMVLCRKGPSGRPRIEMYRSEDSVGGQQPVRMIDLETVRSVQPVGEPEKATVCIRWTCSSWCECTQCVYPHVCNTDSSSAHCAISHHMIWQHLLVESHIKFSLLLYTTCCLICCTCLHHIIW
jgi:hypothetical protein